jgi:predicted transcriptional regulator
MTERLIEMTTEIVANYVTGNTISQSDLPALIGSVFRSLSTVDSPPPPEAEPQVKLTSAQIRKSISPEGLVSFEDGKTYQTLKRHLTTRGMTISDYKAKWGLPSDYPATAPAYAAKRSALAKAAGLGQKMVKGRAAAAAAKKAKPKAAKPKTVKARG